jgi:hypothetical protein
VEPVIKNQDGKIGSKNSYGNDPCVGLPGVLVGWAALVQPYSLLRYLAAVLAFPIALAGVANAAGRSQLGHLASRGLENEELHEPLEVSEAGEEFLGYPSSLFMAKKFFSPPQFQRCNLWEYEDRSQKYESFIINEDEFGRVVACYL